MKHNITLYGSTIASKKKALLRRAKVSRIKLQDKVSIKTYLYKVLDCLDWLLMTPKEEQKKVRNALRDAKAYEYIHINHVRR